MKPKYKQNLGQLVRFYYPQYHDYQLKVYIDGQLKFDNVMELIDSFGYDYLNVVEYYRKDSTKAICIYTSENV